MEEGESINLPHAAGTKGTFKDFNPEDREGKDRDTRNERTGDPWQNHEQGRYPSNVIGEVEGYEKYFFCPKVGRNERHIGHDLNDIGTDPGGRIHHKGEVRQEAEVTYKNGNNHPTVKPKALMGYLVRLVTPKGGRVLDPFCGSGSTGLGCIDEGMEFTGIELDPNYKEIAEKRLNQYNKDTNQTTFKDLFDE
jgi:DNA modification methylase